MKISEMHKHGWIQIDPDKPINEQVSIGDYLIWTEMFLFDSVKQEFSIDSFNKNKEDFRIVFVDEIGIIIKLDQRRADEDTLNYVNPYWDISVEEGLFFVLKSEINYINVKVPDFMLDKVKQLGGVEI